MEFVADGANIPSKMEVTMKDNGETVKCKDKEGYTIGHKSLHMKDLGIEMNFLGKESFIMSILLNLRYLSTTAIYLWSKISGLTMKVLIQ